MTGPGDIQGGERKGSQVYEMGERKQAKSGRVRGIIRGRLSTAARWKRAR